MTPHSLKNIFKVNYISLALEDLLLVAYNPAAFPALIGFNSQ